MNITRFKFTRKLKKKLDKRKMEIDDKSWFTVFTLKAK